MGLKKYVVPVIFIAIVIDLFCTDIVSASISMLVFQYLLFLLPAILAEARELFEPRAYNGTTSWSSVRYIDLTPPLVLEAGGRLMHVLDAADPNRALRFEAANLTACRPNLQLAYSARYPRRAVSLANGKLVVWLLNYRLTTSRHIAEWRFQIVEPSVCRYADFKIRDSDPLPIDVVDVVGYGDSFDVFLVGLAEEEPRNLYVYRYGDDGKPASSAVISVIADVDSGPFYRPNSIRVHAAFKHDPTHGYFFVHSRPDLNTTTIRRLNSKFTTGSSILLDHSSQLIYSTSHSNVTACYFESSEPWLHCAIYDEWLNKMSSVSLSYFADEHLRQGRRGNTILENLPGGGALLLHSVETGNRTATLIIGQRIFADGSFSSTTELGKVDCQVYWLRVFQMPDGNHCISASCDETVYTRCGFVK